MSYTQHLREDQWERIKDSLPGKVVDPGRSSADGVIWIGRNGTRWRSLPPQYIHWSSVHKRFKRGSVHTFEQHLHSHFQLFPHDNSVPKLSSPELMPLTLRMKFEESTCRYNLHDL